MRSTDRPGGTPFHDHTDVENAMPVRPVPEGYHTVTPYLVVDNAQTLIEFAKRAFDATVGEEMKREDGTIMHAELQIGDSRIMLGQANEQHKAMPCALYLYVPDTDATYKKALAAGAVSTMEPANQFYGDRNAGVRDQNGITWWIGTHVEDVSPEELKKRGAAEEAKRRQMAASRG
jgi:uncharacterized glyoxalase superfamily protein PhnB